MLSARTSRDIINPSSAASTRQTRRRPGGHHQRQNCLLRLRGYLIEDGRSPARQGATLIGSARGPQIRLNGGQRSRPRRRHRHLGKNGQSVPVGVGIATTKLEPHDGRRNRVAQHSSPRSVATDFAPLQASRHIETYQSRRGESPQCAVDGKKSTSARFSPSPSQGRGGTSYWKSRTSPSPCEKTPTPLQTVRG